MTELMGLATGQILAKVAMMSLERNSWTCGRHVGSRWLCWRGSTQGT